MVLSSNVTSRVCKYAAATNNLCHATDFVFLRIVSSRKIFWGEKTVHRNTASGIRAARYAVCNLWTTLSARIACGLKSFVCRYQRHCWESDEKRDSDCAMCLKTAPRVQVLFNVNTN